MVAETCKGSKSTQPDAVQLAVLGARRRGQAIRAAPVRPDTFGDAHRKVLDSGFEVRELAYQNSEHDAALADGSLQDRWPPRFKTVVGDRHFERNGTGTAGGGAGYCCMLAQQRTSLPGPYIGHLRAGLGTSYLAAS